MKCDGCGFNSLPGQGFSLLWNCTVYPLIKFSQGNSPRFAGSTKLRTVSFHALLFYGPMYILSIFHHLSIPVSSTLSIVPIYLPFPEVHTPFAYI